MARPSRGGVVQPVVPRAALTDSFQDSCNTSLSFLTSDLCQFKELSKAIPQGNSDFIPELHHHYYSYTTSLFSLIFNIFAPEQGAVVTSEVIFSAECLSKGSFSYSPVFFSLYSLDLQVPLTCAAVFTSGRKNLRVSPQPNCLLTQLFPCV